MGATTALTTVGSEHLAPCLQHWFSSVWYVWLCLILSLTQVLIPGPTTTRHSTMPTQTGRELVGLVSPPLATVVMVGRNAVQTPTTAMCTLFSTIMLCPSPHPV